MNTEKTEAKENGTEITKRWNVRDILEKLCHVGVYIFLFFFVVVYAFYAPEGYIQIATNKYRFFRKMGLITAGIMVPLVTLHYIISPTEKDPGKKEQRISLTDIFVLVFFLINIISFFLSEYRDEAIWGTGGWYMGFAMHFFFVGIYFMMSRLYDRKIDLLPIFMGVTFVVFAWGLLNRFSIYPIDMQYDSVSFLSSMGNINWLCGYWSVFFLTGVVLYIVTEKRVLRIFSGVYSVVALGFGTVEGSDSAYISLGVVFFFMFLVSFRKTEYMKRWLEEGIFYCAACQVMRLIVIMAPQSLNWTGSTVKWMLSNLTLVALFIFAALRILLEIGDKKYKKYTVDDAKEDEQAETELIWKWKWLKYTVIGLTVTVATVYLVLLIINTRTPGILGPLSKYPVLLFDGNWGSNRGTTWRDGLSIYQTFSWKQRLFGVGQDCFSAYGYSIPELEARFEEHWPDSRLTNAHNECITYLVNLGIFGLLSFIGIFWSSFKRLLEKAVREPVCYVFAACLLSYFFHNQFSFSQVLNTPYIFMMLGLGENLMRKADLESVP